MSSINRYKILLIIIGLTSITIVLFYFIAIVMFDNGRGSLDNFYHLVSFLSKGVGRIIFGITIFVIIGIVYSARKNKVELENGLKLSLIYLVILWIVYAIFYPMFNY